MTKLRLIAILSLLLSLPVLGQILESSVRFFGQAPEYAGYNLVFYRYSNHIIPQTEALITLTLDKEGRFDFTFPASEITYLFSDLGRFRAYIYIEPGFAYQLVLPPFEPKTQAQKLSPHFQPEEIPMGIANEEAQALNRNIFEFNNDFESQLNTNAVTLFLSGNTKLAEKIETELEEKHTFCHPFFLSYKNFSYLKLWHMTQRRQERQLILRYYSNSPIQWNLPVYWEAFTTLFSGFLPGKSQINHEKKLIDAFKPNAPFDSIIDLLTTDTLFVQRELAETVTLFNLFESFYDQSMGEETVLTITQSAMITASTPNTREMARQFYLKLSQLRPGTTAPDFTLTDQNGKIKTLQDYSGKFVYLNFIHTQNHASLRDLQTIEQFRKSFRKELSIVSIVLDEHYEAMEAFLNQHKDFDWDFLHFGAAPKVLFDYNIKAVPAYFLIDPEGKLTLSPAPTPEENFTQMFIERYREHQRTQLRKTPPRERSIFKW